MLDFVKIYSDGSARGNPNGPGGFGTILEYTDSSGKIHTREYSEGFVRTTNNRMELMGVITGFEHLNKPCRVEVISDSQYVCKAFNDHWIDGWVKAGLRQGKNKKVKNPDLWNRLLNAMEGHEVTFTWVKGHAGHVQNERCDKLATAAADGDSLLTDEYYMSTVG